MDYIKVENSDGDITEIEVDDDGMVGMETIRAQFGDVAVGLRYKNEETGCWRAISCASGRLIPPKSGWQDIKYSLQLKKQEKERYCKFDNVTNRVVYSNKQICKDRNVNLTTF